MLQKPHPVIDVGEKEEEENVYDLKKYIYGYQRRERVFYRFFRRKKKKKKYTLKLNEYKRI